MCECNKQDFRFGRDIELKAGAVRELYFFDENGELSGFRNTNYGFVPTSNAFPSLNFQIIEKHPDHLKYLVDSDGFIDYYAFSTNNTKTQ